jgi:hypothetical protein
MFKQALFRLAMLSDSKQHNELCALDEGSRGSGPGDVALPDIAFEPTSGNCCNVWIGCEQVLEHQQPNESCRDFEGISTPIRHRPETGPA